MLRTDPTLVGRRLNDNINTIRYIHSKDFQEERELQEVKWFEYRFISPWKATMVFARAYENWCKNAVAAQFDRNKKVQPIDWRKVGQRSTLMTQLWKARQNADRLGLPYPVYFEFFDGFIFRRPRKRVPRPNQIEGSPDAKKAWSKMVVAFKQERAWPMLARMDVPQLHLDNHKGLAAQDAFMQFALAAAESSPLTHAQALAELCYRRCLLRPDAFKSKFDSEEYDRHSRNLQADVAAGRIVPVPADTVSAAAFWPSCFGLEGPAKDEAPSPCTACPFKPKCGKAHAYTLKYFSARPTLHTADDVRKKLGRERTAVFRQKQVKAGASA